MKLRLKLIPLILASLMLITYCAISIYEVYHVPECGGGFAQTTVNRSGSIWNDILNHPPAGYCRVKTSDAHFKNRPPLQLIFSRLSGLSQAISPLLAKGVIAPEAFEELDFSIPGDITYGDDVGIEVFNPTGILKATPIQQELIDKVSTTKGTKILYNLRRLETENGGAKDVLYAILTDVDEQACAEASEASRDIDNNRLRSMLKSVDNIEIGANNQKILVDKIPLPSFAYCIQTPDQKNLTFIYLVKRIKKSGGDKWQIQ